MPESGVNKGTQTNVRLDDDLIAWVKEYASAHDRTFAYVVNSQLQRWRRQVERARDRRRKDALGRHEGFQ